MCHFLCSPVPWGAQGKQPSKVPAISGIQPRAMIPFLPTEPPNQPQLQQQAPASFTGEHHAQSSEMRRKHQRTRGPSQGVGFAELERSEKPMNGLLWRADRLPTADTVPCNVANKPLVSRLPELCSLFWQKHIDTTAPAELHLC